MIPANAKSTTLVSSRRSAARRLPAVYCSLLLATLLAAACSRGAPSCPACERSECRNMTFTIHLAGGRAIRTCCPRCGLRYVASQHLSPISYSVRAFDTAEVLDAAHASFIEGSDVSPCTANTPAGPTDERGCCMNRVFDRCLPSLVAFVTPERAASFMRAHGGELRTFDALRSARP